jgi:hypothetical protein
VVDSADWRQSERGFYESFRRSKDLPTFMVLFEDSAALLGILIAALWTYAATRLQKRSRKRLIATSPVSEAIDDRPPVVGRMKKLTQPGRGQPDLVGPLRRYLIPGMTRLRDHRTNNPVFRSTLFQTHLRSRPRRADRKDHLSPIRERQTRSP